MKRVLLTGASGTVGKEVLSQLYEFKDEFEITVFDIESKKTRSFYNTFQKYIEVIYGDISVKKDIMEKKGQEHNHRVIGVSLAWGSSNGPRWGDPDEIKQEIAEIHKDIEQMETRTALYFLIGAVLLVGGVKCVASEERKP